MIIVVRATNNDSIIIMALKLIISSLILTIIVRNGIASSSARKNSDAREQAAALLAQMTLSEKISLLHGSSGSDGYVGYVNGIERLNIPALKLGDGPNGFRDDNRPGSSTCWPAALTVAATWDKDLCQQWGEAMGKEFHQKGANVQLGPGLNVARVPWNGRNFEYLSGADPFLGYTLVQPLIRGIQSQKVIANAKHWIHNNQETDRSTVSENVDERTRHEVYYPPFVGAIEAEVGSFMCSYNKVNGLWSCENPATLKGDLKEVLGFTNGWVMSDWGATHSTSILQGLDQEMPGSDFFSDEALTKLVQDGTVPESQINDSVMRILVPMISIGVMNDVSNSNNNNNSISNNVTSAEHTLLARNINAASHILLQNQHNLLPLSKSAAKKILLLGSAGISPIVAGGGSGAVFPAHIVSPFQGLLDALEIADTSSTGSYNCQTSLLEEDVEYQQYGCESAPSTSVEDCCEQCGRYSSCQYFTYSSSGRCNFYPTGGKRRPAQGSVSAKCDKKPPSSDWHCNTNGGCVAFNDGTDSEVAMSLAKEADVVIVAVATFSKEGNDRTSLSFNDEPDSSYCQMTPPGQDILVTQIAGTGVPTIVAAVAPGSVLMPWKDSVQAILLSFMPGEEYGHALADVLFGETNPSGRLPITLPNVENEMEFTRLQYPGILLQGNYSEQLLVDYRWYLANKVTPAFPFGHGLSYSTFEYSGLAIAASLSTTSTGTVASITVTVRNTGAVAGHEVVQLYLGFPAGLGEPPLQLKGFEKTPLLAPGDFTTVTFDLVTRDVSIWDDQKTHSWQQVAGKFQLSIGSSSQDIRLVGTLELQ